MAQSMVVATRARNGIGAATAQVRTEEGLDRRVGLHSEDIAVNPPEGHSEKSGSFGNVIAHRIDSQTR
jgi:hypothetical protein